MGLASSDREANGVHTAFWQKASEFHDVFMPFFPSYFFPIPLHGSLIHDIISSGLQHVFFSFRLANMLLMAMAMERDVMLGVEYRAE